MAADTIRPGARVRLCKAWLDTLLGLMPQIAFEEWFVHNYCPHRRGTVRTPPNEHGTVQVLWDGKLWTVGIHASNLRRCPDDV
jgi:hypothetical protein